MIPVYSTSTFLSNWFYWHSVYFQLVSATYAAIAVSSYFSLLCHYVAPYMHDYKNFFRGVVPKPWGNFFPVPIGWFRACCGGERGIWRTPRSGLTWFNVGQPSLIVSGCYADLTRFYGLESFSTVFSVLQCRSWLPSPNYLDDTARVQSPQSSPISG